MRIALVSLLLAGCTHTVWHKAGVTSAERKKDSYECQRDVDQAGYNHAINTGLREDDRWERCMEARGYVAVEK